MNIKKHPTRDRGLTLIEIMMGLAISAVLLVAVFTAINTSINAFKINQQQGITLNQSRLAMNHIVSRLRMTNVVQPYTGTKDAGPVHDFMYAKIDPKTSKHQAVRDSGITLTGFDIVRDSKGSLNGNDNYAIWYWKQGDKLMYQESKNKGNKSTPITLLRGVTDFTVTFYPARSALSPVNDVLGHATINLTVQSTGETTGIMAQSASSSKPTYTVSASVYPRCNLFNAKKTPDQLDPEVAY